MLTLHTGHSVAIGTHLYGIQGWNPNDPLLGGYTKLVSLLQRAYVSTSPMDPNIAFGTNVNVSPHQETHLSIRPIERGHDHLSDYRRYSFPIGEVLRLATPEEGGGQVFENDKSCIHYNLSGSIRPKDSGLYTYSYLDRDGQPFPSINERWPWLWTQTFALAAHPSGGYWSLQPSNSGLFNYSVKELMKWFEKSSRSPNNLFGVSLPSGPRVSGHYDGFIFSGHSDVKYTLTDTSLSCTYIDWYDNRLSGAARRAEVALEMRWSWDASASYSPSGALTPKVWIQVSLNQKGFYGPALGGDVPGYANINAWDYEGSISYSWTPDVVFPVTQVYLVDPRKADGFFSSLKWKGFTDQAEQSLRWARSATTHSWADAYSSIVATAADWVEFSAEAGELAELYPEEQIRLLESAATADRVVNGRLYTTELSTRLRDVALAAASGYILYSFSWRPLSGTPEEAARTLEGLSRMAGRLEQESRVYGKFSVDEPTVEMLPGVTLRPNRLSVITRAVVGGLPKTHASNVTQLDAIGVLPTPSRLWNTLMWSWFADWLLKVQEKQRILESYILGALIGARGFSHSFTMDWDFDDGDFAEYFGFEPAEVPARVRVYVREKSRYLPALFAADNTSAFSPAGGIKWEIFLSLLVTFFL